MATRIYLHVATNPIASLPTTEQSTNTSVYSLNPVSTNFLMDTTIGVSQVTRPTSGTSSSTGKTYIGRWVSDTLGGTTQIDANTWTLNFAATDAGSAKFPVTGSNAAMIVCAYVWRPGTGKVGSNIIDGASGANFQVGTTTEKVEHGTFTGAQVTGVQSNDVLCIELWSDTAGAGSGWAYRVYFDGTTENTTPAATVSNHAAFVETPQNITFPLHITKALTTETVSVSESLDILLAKVRTPTTESITISESIKGYYARIPQITISDSIARIKTSSGNNVVKTMSTETIAITSTLTRLATKARALVTETVSKGETIARLKTRKIALATETIAVTAGTLARLSTKIRALATQTTAITQVSITRLSAKIRTATDTVSKGESVARLRPLIRSLPIQSVSNSESIIRLIAKIRTASDTIGKSESSTVLRAKVRTVIQTTSIVDAVDRRTQAVTQIARALATETIAVVGTLTRLSTKLRTLSDTAITVSASLARLSAKVKTSSDTITITASLAKLSAKTRTITDSIAVLGVLTRLLAKIRTKIDVTGISDGVTRTTSIATFQVTRTITETAIAITDGIAKRLAKVRTGTDSIVVPGSLTRLVSKLRLLSDTVSKGENLVRMLAKVRPITAVQIVTISESISRLLAKVRTKTESVSIAESVDTVLGGPAKHIVRIINELDIIVGDFFHKTRAIATEIIEITESIETVITNNLHIPIHFVRVVEEEPNIITDEVICFKPTKDVVMSLTDSTSFGDTTDKRSGKVRTIGGPG